MTFIGQNYLREQAGADDRYKASTKAQLEKMKTLLYETKMCIRDRNSGPE